LIHVPGGALEWIIVGALGALVGTGEIMARYTDSPGRAVMTSPGLFYIGLNTVASLVALWLLTILDWHYGQGGAPGNEQAVGAFRVLTAGLGAVIFLRSAVITVGGPEGRRTEIGPSRVLEVILAATGRALDRAHGVQRADTVRRVMTGISFDQARTSLPTYCLALVPASSPELQDSLAAQVSLLAARQDISENIKLKVLGLLLMNLVGPGVLERAVAELKQELNP
jgi:hypothetical protein